MPIRVNARHGPVVPLAQGPDRTETNVLTTAIVERVIALPPEPAGGFDVHQAYPEHARPIYGFALNSTRDSTIAEDCVQETFVRAWRARESYRSARGSQRTWLFAIARNVVVDAMRSSTRRPVPVSDEQIEAGTESRSEDEWIVDRVDVHRALAALNTEHREVIVAVQLDGMTYRQLAERTGVPPATLRTRMFYGLKALREELREEDKR